MLKEKIKTGQKKAKEIISLSNKYFNKIYLVKSSTDLLFYSDLDEITDGMLVYK